MTMETSTAGVTQTVLDFVRANGDVDPGDADLNAGTDLFDMGYLDSLAVVALTAHLETTYNITLSEQELFDPRMATAVGIAEIIASHAPASPSTTRSTPPAGDRNT